MESRLEDKTHRRGQSRMERLISLDHMTLRCRPRAGGDPYAVSYRCCTACEPSKARWLWVPACAGTTASLMLPPTVSSPIVSQPPIQQVILPHPVDAQVLAGEPFA